MASRTITLTDRPPVRIDEDNWPYLASASDTDYEGQYEFQSFRKSKWSLIVRQHQDDARTLVYAVYTYTTAWQGERDYCARHGEYLDSADSAAIVSAIRRVGRRMAECEHHGDDAERWSSLIDECIADMPAEELS